MKLTFIPTGTAPGYTIAGEQINGIDLSVLGTDDTFIGDDTTRAAGIRDAHRDAANELHVTLAQAVGSGHWEAGAEIDAALYDPTQVYVTYTEQEHRGTPHAVTSRGKVDPRDDEVIPDA